MTNFYDDIMNLPHHQSATRPHMSAYDRAAQFSPFAALTGYDAAVAETARQTDRKVDLDEWDKAVLNERLTIIRETLNEHPEVSITFFVADEKKAGGAYITVTGGVKKIDAYEHLVVMLDGTEIPIDDIFEINGSMFAGLENLE